MTSLSTVALVCLLIYLGGCDVTSNNNMPVSKCPPAEIGKPFTLEYMAYVINGINFISWEVKYNKSSKDVPVAKCDAFGCNITKGHNYTAEIQMSIHRQRTEIKSKLTTPSVTLDMEDMVFVSYAAQNGSGLSVIHMTCAMNLFLVPADPRCDAQLMKEGGVFVTCNTSSVYPGLVCEMYEQATITGVDSGVMTTIAQENISYRVTNYSTTAENIYSVGHDSLAAENISHSIGNESLTTHNFSYLAENDTSSLSDNSLRAAKCSTVVYPENPGVYRYVVNMYPLLHNSGLRLSPSTAITNAVSTMSTRVELEEFPYIYLCPHRKDIVSFRCRAKGFTETPQFFWHIGNMTVKAESVKKITSDNTNDFVYSVTYNFTPMITDHKTLVTCEVNSILPGTTILTKVTDSKELILDWPEPYPVAFKSQRGVILGQDVYVGAENDAQVKCELNGSDPDISCLAVVCWKDNQTSILEVKSTDSKSVLFTVPNEINTRNITCECSAVHTTQQCNYTTTVMFYGHYAEKTTYSYPMIFVLGTLLATVCIIVLILLGYLYYRRNKQPKIQECKHCSSHEYEAIVMRPEENVSASADPQNYLISSTPNTCHEWISSDQLYIDPDDDSDEESVNTEKMCRSVPSSPSTNRRPIRVAKVARSPAVPRRQMTPVASSSPIPPPPPPPTPPPTPCKLRVNTSVV